MTEERTTVHERADGGIERTTVITDGNSSGGGSKAWIWILIVLIIAGAAIFIATNQSDSEIARDAAITDAANDVGNAAQSVGDAAQDAADNLGGE